MFGFLIKPQQEEPKESEVEVLQKQVATLKPEDLKVLAEEKAVEIFSNIQRVSSKIDKAKDLTGRANNVKGDAINHLFRFIGESKAEKRSKLNTQANIMQNEAMAEMNTLIQESIKLTTISYGFAQTMTQTIAAMLENGFKDKDGDIQQLHGVAKEQALVMLDEAQRFVKHQQEYEKRQEKQEQDISTQGEKIQELQEQLESKRTKIKELESTLKSKDSLDDKQSQSIQTLQNELQAQSQALAKKGVLPLWLAAGALVLAMASLVLHFV